jgi:hypothetical protein
LDAGEQRRLVREGALSERDAPYLLVDVEGGAGVTPHAGSLAWNAHRRRWIALFGQAAATPSFLGEIWFAEADSPTGPWAFARRVVTHDRMTFYNPVHHPFLDSDAGRVIRFEGTYTTTFSAAPAPTPRYEYNQILYRLDLADARLALPVAWYLRDDAPDRPAPLAPGAGSDALRAVRSIAFFAPPPSEEATAAPAPPPERERRAAPRDVLTLDRDARLPGP